MAIKSEKKLKDWKSEDLHKLLTSKSTRITTEGRKAIEEELRRRNFNF